MYSQTPSQLPPTHLFHGDTADLHLYILWQARYLHRLPRRKVLCEKAPIHRIDPREIIHIADEDRGLHDMREVHMVGSEYSAYIMHHLLGFSFYIAFYYLAGLRIYRYLA